MNYMDLFRMTLPETALEIAALVVLTVDLGFLRKATLEVRRFSAAILGVMGCSAAVFALTFQSPDGLSYPPTGELLLTGGGYAAVAQVGILTLTVLTLFLLIDTDFTRHVGEYVAVVLMAAMGGLLIAAAQDLLIIFVGLELIEPGSLHPDGLRQEIGEERRSGHQVLPVWRHVGRVPSVWLQLSLWNHRIDESAPDHAGHVRIDRCQCGAVGLCGSGDGGGRVGLQGCCGSVSSLGARYL